MSQLAVFFTNLDDAKQVLREMAQSPSYAGDARILVVSMEKAYTMVKTGAKQTGWVLRSTPLSMIYPYPHVQLPSSIREQPTTGDVLISTHNQHLRTVKLASHANVASMPFYGNSRALSM